MGLPELWTATSGALGRTGEVVDVDDDVGGG